MLPLPPSIRLATWGTAALRGLVPLADVPDGAAVNALLLPLRESGISGLRAVLVAPGDVVGLPGPPAFNAVACDVGECVVAVDAWPAGSGATVALVPGEGGWTVHAVEHRPTLAVTDLGEADQGLREALLEAAEILGELDVARWRPEAAERWADLSAASLDGGEFPPGLPTRAIAVLATGLRLRAVLELALEDDGGAVSGWEAGRRAEVLRRLDGVARRALSAAASAPPR